MEKDYKCAQAKLKHFLKSHQDTIPPKILQKMYLLESILDGIQSTSLDQLSEDEIQQLRSQPREVQIRLFIEISKTFTIHEKEVVGQLDILGKSGIFWNKREISLDIERSILKIAKKMKDKKPKIVFLQDASVKWLPQEGKRFRFQLMNQKIQIFGSEHEQHLQQWFQYIKYCCNAFDDTLMQNKTRQSFIQPQRQRSQTQSQSLAMPIQEQRSIQNVSSIQPQVMSQSLDEIQSTRSLILPKSEQIINVNQENWLPQKTIQHEVKGPIDEFQDEFNKNQLCDEYEYNVTNFDNNLRVLQHKDDPTKIKCFLIVNSTNLLTIVSALTVPEYLTKWNLQIDTITLLDVLTSTKTILIMEQRKKYGMLYAMRYFTYLHHIAETDDGYFILQKSIDYNETTKSFSSFKGEIVKNVIGIFPQGQQTLIVFNINTHNGGYASKQQDSLLTLTYLNQLKNLGVYLQQKSHLEPPSYITNIRKQVRRKSSEECTDFSDLKLKNSSTDVEHPIDEKQQLQELLEIVEKYPEKIWTKALHIYPLQPMKPTNKYKTQSDNGLNLILKDEWEILDKGGFKFINKRKLAIQKEVLSYMLTQMGKSLLTAKSIINISLPVNIFEKKSNLERLCYGYSYLWLIEKAAQLDDPLEQMKLVMQFGISNIVMYLNMDKPFNPILGETFQGYMNGNLIYVEQISHHPPVAGLLFKGRDFTLTGQIEQQARFHLNSITGQNYGLIKIEFKNTTIQFGATPGLVTGITYGDRCFFFDGSSWYIDIKNNLVGEIIATPFPGVFSKKTTPQDYLEGGIYQVPDQEILKFKSETWKKYKGPRGQGKKVANISGRWTQGVEFDGKEVINWTKDFPYELEFQPDPLASDCKFREDLIAFKLDDLELAQQRKEKLEVIQRNDRKLRKK